ncbi:hypothetical protein [Bacteriovorax sp. DB6_IX]|uniref:hypothetical protein n=1 Tax=Bacteriovorax sp. DB6_IX TaxID=1353530 RepID=UPI00038A2A64|nr:hypothetical protein [Bacteriovorax sp. DB6_IX]EQC51454.1 hypothetical protein M901_1959 [Bacteriovorax sp. DB6_IX]
MRYLFLSIISLGLFISCAGYKVRHNTNPFASQGVNSVAIPMFINKTSLPVVTAAYTKAIHEVLSNYPDLRVNSGELENEDAVVLGVVKRVHDKEISFTGSTLMNNSQLSEIGDRNAFYLPTTGTYDLRVELYILKRPTKEEIDFFVNYFKFSKSAFPRTIFSKTFGVSGSYNISNEIGDIDSAAPVRGTQTRGNMVKALSDSSVALANEFREVLSNAY